MTLESRSIDPAVMSTISRSYPLTSDDRASIQRSKLWWVYAGVLIRPAVACLLVERRMPDLSHENTVLRLDDGVFTACDMRRQRWLDSADLDRAFDEVLVQGHLAYVAEAFAEAFPDVPVRTFWGNAATSWARCVIELEDLGCDGSLARRHLAAIEAGSVLGRMGRFADVPFGGGRTIRGYHRRSCCLWWKIPGVEVCRDCSLLDPSDWEAGVRADAGDG